MPRPRLHPEGTTATQRAEASDAALLATGGRLLRVRLSSAATAALARIREAGGDKSDRQAIERVLLTFHSCLTSAASP